MHDVQPTPNADTVDRREVEKVVRGQGAHQVRGGDLQDADKRPEDGSYTNIQQEPPHGALMR